MPIEYILEIYSPLVEAFSQSLDQGLLSWESLTVIVLATLFGMFFGLLPGFGGVIAMVLILPLTFSLSPIQGFLALAACLGGGAFGGSIPAIALKVPGGAANIATCWDGNEMAKKGETDRAIGAAAAASSLGAIHGLILFVLLLPFLRQLVLLFGPPEIFTAALVGLFVIAIFGRNRPVKGSVALLFGLSLGFVGIHLITLEHRFTFDFPYLTAGVYIIPVAVGLYAIGESGKLILHMDVVSGLSESVDESLTIQGVKDVFRNKSLFLRSASLGWVIGLIPGVGGTLANVLAYTQGKSMHPNPDLWGTGIPEGVIAPEASNDAKDGGALIPTLTFGIPGSGAQIFFLAGMVFHGIFPGRDMLVDNLHITLTIVFGLIASNLLTSAIGILLSSEFKKITQLPTTPLAGFVMLIAFIGTYASRSNVYDLYVAFIFGIIGYLMWRYSYPRIVLLIALILGPIIDKTFANSMDLYGSFFWTRPIPLITIVLLILLLIRSYKPNIFGIDNLRWGQ